MRLRFLTLALSAFALLPTLACGRGLSDSLDDPGTSPGGDAGEDGGGCIGSPPGCGYGTCDTSDPLSAICFNGHWQCPELGFPDCPAADAGEDACSSEPPIACAGSSGCPGVYATPSCTGGQWSCVVTTPECPEDAGVDAAPPPPASFACGDLACDTSTSYCQIDTGGAAQPDGGVESSYACNPLPTFCGSGASLTCDCGVPWLPTACGCITNNGVMIVTCAEP
jgi:hypothetical protein